MKYLDPERLLEETDYDKDLLYKTLNLFLQNSKNIETRIHKAFEKKDHNEVYKASSELEIMVEVFDIKPLSQKLKDLQALALHNNLNGEIAITVKTMAFDLLIELKEEMHFILHDQKGI